MNENAAKPKILVIDPHFQTLRDLAVHLEPEFTLLSAGEQEQALEIIRENPDLSVILLDDSLFQTEEASIISFAREFLANTSFVIMKSQIQWLEAKEKIKSDEIQGFVEKPLDYPYLMAVIHSAYHLFNTKSQLSGLEKIAITDSVTGLANSRYFQSSVDFKLDESTKKLSRLSVFLVDVDQFKNFNDNFGYGEGDKLLTAIGERIKKLIPEGTTVFRFGSDEFGFMLSLLEGRQDIEIAERLRQGFEQHPFFGPYKRPAYVTVSVGIAHCPDHGKQYGDLISSAQAALQQAKRRGRNQTVVAYFC
ncbi:MAG: diguanylate cyclase response regulator [Pseudomonadota bacterium]|nr:diguanylate cyclase response regulator [Pseudomonadota bacterium]